MMWLSYYLRKDVHPESKKMIIRIFIWGAAITLPVFFVQIGLQKVLNISLAGFGLPDLNYLLRSSFSNLQPLGIIAVSIYWFLIISFSEEIFKYLVVRFRVFTHYEFDEPVDAMLYMVIAALGFAALENILYLFSPIDVVSFNDALNRTIVVSLVRFLGATFLHTLCSGVIGYFMALAFCETEKKIRLVFLGIFIATFFHGLYDFSIMGFRGPLQFLLPIAILTGLAIFVFSAFNKVKSMKSICKFYKSRS